MFSALFRMVRARMPICISPDFIFAFSTVSSISSIEVGAHEFIVYVKSIGRYSVAVK